MRENKYVYVSSFSQKYKQSLLVITVMSNGRNQSALISWYHCYLVNVSTKNQIYDCKCNVCHQDFFKSSSIYITVSNLCHLRDAVYVIDEFNWNNLAERGNNSKAQENVGGVY